MAHASTPPPPPRQCLQNGVFFFFAGCVLAMTIFVMLFVPETRNVPIEEIQQVRVAAEGWVSWQPGEGGALALLVYCLDSAPLVCAPPPPPPARPPALTSHAPAAPRRCALPSTGSGTGLSAATTERAMPALQVRRGVTRGEWGPGEGGATSAGHCAGRHP
jgi:hypothetical protein